MLSLPGTQHPYSYALNNPLRYSDPSGESPLLAAMIAGALIGAATATIAEIAVQVVENATVRNMTWAQAIAPCNLDWEDIFFAALTGGMSGALAGLMGTFAIPALMKYLSVSNVFLRISLTVGLKGVGGGVGNVVALFLGNLTKTIYQTIRYGELDFDPLDPDEYMSAYMWGIVTSGLSSLLEETILQRVLNKQGQLAQRYRDRLLSAWCNSLYCQDDFIHVWVQILRDSSESLPEIAEAAERSIPLVIRSIAKYSEITFSDNLWQGLVDVIDRIYGNTDN